MQLTEQHIELFKSICSEWNKAEQDIKLAELVCSDVVIPAIKELRYAGRRIIDAVQAIDSDKSNTEIIGFLNDAKFDCYRARHDSIDVASAKMAKDIEVMVQKIRYDAILKAYPKFPQLLGDLHNIRTNIAKSRMDRQDREKIYSSIEIADMPNMVNLFQGLRACEPMMIALAKDDRREKLITRILTVISLIIAAISFFKDNIMSQIHKWFL